MEIRWANVIAFVFLIIALVIFVMNAHAIASFLATMKNIGSGTASEEEQFKGLLCFGFIAICIVAVVRILVAHSGDDTS